MKDEHVQADGITDTNAHREKTQTMSWPRETPELQQPTIPGAFGEEKQTSRKGPRLSMAQDFTTVTVTWKRPPKLQTNMAFNLESSTQPIYQSSCHKIYLPSILSEEATAGCAPPK